MTDPDLYGEPRTEKQREAEDRQVAVELARERIGQIKWELSYCRQDPWIILGSSNAEIDRLERELRLAREELERVRADYRKTT